MADIKGKGILFEDDDEPIKLTSQDDPKIFDEFSLSLIGKILNPKKQNVEKLLQKMPSHWGPFHFNFCMFVLVRWEPIVHDDYPWIIPLWVHLIGIPLHLWTDRNLQKVGSRMGHVDKVEHTEGRMLIDVDTRWPLKFSRKAESPEGDEVMLEINLRYASSVKKYEGESNYRGSHTDRIMRRREDHSRSDRYGGSRIGTCPNKMQYEV
ncbi:PREDICTED: uncharacterized protein LOC106344908 [Brassica oleracea var. oleracea]|uniref:uncharacterized protein LOC106344908 n=1 Tax=Brassica oleracea var. oleracea TaxID=109376 RepID=UPI0006A6B1B1|nr:PREDICTED: uncharacterized protein LOC106344908 [Brassica oleracea var. oleracea]